MEGQRLIGPRHVLADGDAGFPAALAAIPEPPQSLYLVGSPAAMQEGIAIVGARKATPYGLGCAARFARIAAECGVCVVSGGARGCDAAAQRAALDAGGCTVTFLGGGCDMLYPAENAGLFQRIVDAGGAVVSEHEWSEPPLRYRFRARNRLIAGLARATLIVEAGLPSGTFSTADEALAAGREVLVVPGSITSPASRGANRLLCQGATPVVDDDSFSDALSALFGCRQSTSSGVEQSPGRRLGAPPDALAAALMAEPLGMDRLLDIAQRHSGDEQPRVWLMRKLAEGERAGLFARHPDGRWGPVVR